MVTNEDGQDAYVTADPTLAQSGQRALPLYTLDRKDVLILELYREQHGEALTTLQAATGKVRASAAALGLTIAEWEHKFGTRATPCGECHLQPGERCDVCGAYSGT
jgi:hypothetical protein